MAGEVCLRLCGRGSLIRCGEDAIDRAVEARDYPYLRARGVMIRVLALR